MMENFSYRVLTWSLSFGANPVGRALGAFERKLAKDDFPDLKELIHVSADIKSVCLSKNTNWMSILTTD